MEPIPNETPDETRLRQLLSSESRQRLETLVDTRRELEWTFQPRKKHSYYFDVRFLTENQNGLSPEQEEANFIIRSFQDSPCLQFEDPSHSRYCSMCGQTRDLHDRNDGHQSLQNGTGLSIAVAAEKTDACHSPAITFGAVQIPRRFVGRPSSSTKEMYMSKYLKFRANEDAASHLWSLMTNIWKLKVPSVVFKVTGGDIHYIFPDHMKIVTTAIKKITSQTECWFISDGLNYGLSKYLSKELQSKGPKDKQRKPDSPVFVCVTHWGSLHRKRELLSGISLPSEVNGSQYFYSMEHKLSQENSQVLNPYQAVYLLLDNGLSEAGDCALRFRRKFEHFIKNTAAKQIPSKETAAKQIPSKETAAKQIRSLEEVTLPIVTFVIGGDYQTLDQVLYSVDHKNPVIIVNESGQISRLLSELFYNLEDEHPRTWSEEAGWTDGEAFAFCTYITNTDDKYLRDIFQNMELEEILQKIQEIMKKRYYITVIDLRSENEETLHCRILQGIYKGYSNRAGIAIALKAGTSDFVEALFLRDADHRFTEGHYITTETLNWFHLENLRSEEPISKVLEFMCKEKSIKVDPNISILPVIGRILHLLLGPRYSILYQTKFYAVLPRNEDATTTEEKQSNGLKKNDTTTAEDVEFKDNEEQMWHLFLWSILSAKPDMTQFFLMQTSAPLGALLLAFKLYSRLAFYSGKVFEEELEVKLKSAAHQFQEDAIKTLDNMYNMDTDEAFRVLGKPLPFDIGLEVTPLLIADDSDAKDFMVRPCCQAYLQEVWRGNITDETHVSKKKLIEKPTDDECENTKPKRGTFCKVKSCTAPVTKFYAWMFAYIGFLSLLSYYVLTDLKPFTSIAEITVAEWVLIFWEAMLIVEEIAQLIAIYEHAVELKFSVDDVKLSSDTWYYNKKLRTYQYTIDRYLYSGRWNSVDVTIVSLFIVSFTLRFSLPLETFQMARIIFAVTIIVCYFRLLRYLSALETLGPSIIAIQMMLTELLKFFVVLALFVVSFGIAFQAILNPNQTPSWTTFADILYRPYWEMFGELFLGDGLAKMGRPVSNVSSCQAMAEEQSLYANGTDINCYEWAAPVLLGIYLLISSVLLLNLLVAIFSTAYNNVAEMSVKVSKYNRYSLTQEFFYLVWLPPPLNILAHLYRCIIFFAKRCDRKKEDDGLSTAMPCSAIIPERGGRDHIGTAMPYSAISPERGGDDQIRRTIPYSAIIPERGGRDHIGTAMPYSAIIPERGGDDQIRRTIPYSANIPERGRGDKICTAIPYSAIIQERGGDDQICTAIARDTIIPELERDDQGRIILSPTADEDEIHIYAEYCHRNVREKDFETGH